MLLLSFLTEEQKQKVVVVLNKKWNYFLLNSAVFHFPAILNVY